MDILWETRGYSVVMDCFAPLAMTVIARNVVTWQSMAAFLLGRHVSASLRGRRPWQSVLTPQGTRIPTTSVRTGLGMTMRVRPQFERRPPETGRRLPRVGKVRKSVIARSAATRRSLFPAAQPE